MYKYYSGDMHLWYFVTMPLILILLFVLIIMSPQWWVQRVIKRYQKPLDTIPGTGGELATHLLKQLKIEDVEVSVSEIGDHYDPKARKIGLSEANYSGKSLAAVAIAAHEVGHCIQHQQKMSSFVWRERMVKLAITSEKLGVMSLMAVPFVGGILRIPHPVVALLVIGFGSMVIGVIVHLVTLPVEFDASFNKALPLLTEGQYIDQKQTQAVRKILKAAAMTYVAATLASMLNIWRWIAIIKR